MELKASGELYRNESQHQGHDTTVQCLSIKDENKGKKRSLCNIYRCDICFHRLFHMNGASRVKLQLSTFLKTLNSSTFSLRSSFCSADSSTTVCIARDSASLNSTRPPLSRLIVVFGDSRLLLITILIYLQKQNRVLGPPTPDCRPSVAHDNDIVPFSCDCHCRE